MHRRHAAILTVLQTLAWHPQICLPDPGSFAESTHTADLADALSSADATGGPRSEARTFENFPGEHVQLCLRHAERMFGSGLSQPGLTLLRLAASHRRNDSSLWEVLGHSLLRDGKPTWWINDVGH